MSLRRRIERILRTVRSLPDRMRHQSRRAAALAALRDASVPTAILVVCHGNLCRSPYAAAALRRALASAGVRVPIESAGFVAPNRAPPAMALAAASDRGASLAAHRSRMLDRELIDSADLVLVMDHNQARGVTARLRDRNRRGVVILGDLDPHPIQSREILDPLGGSRDAFDFCYDRIDRCVSEIVRALTRAS